MPMPCILSQCQTLSDCFYWFAINDQILSLLKSLPIHSKCGEMRTRITPNTDSFYAVDGVSKNTISAYVQWQCKKLILTANTNKHLT